MSTSYKYVCWVDPFGPNCDPVYTFAEPSTVIKIQRAVAEKSGFDYPSDDAALDDFLVVHWASLVDIPVDLSKIGKS